MSNVTPRKRKIGAIDSPAKTPRGQGRNAPAPNPPLVPFPTPPSTRHRHLKAATTSIPSQPDFSQLDSSPSGSSSKRPLSDSSLPPHLQGLLNLHNAFNLALSLHIATHPPVLPPHPPSSIKLDLPSLTNFQAIKEIVERTGGRRFGLPELGRLAWIWQWDGRALPDDKATSLKSGKGEDDNPFLVASEKPSTSSIRVEGLSYLITPTRTLDANGRRVHTHGLGIELDLKPGETRQMLIGGNEGGLGNRGQGGGMAAVGRWNAGQEQREETFRQRLDRWVELHGGYEPPEPSLLPTPTTSGSSRSNIPPIPILPLPHLGPSTSLPGGGLFASMSSSKTDSSPGLSSLPKPSKVLDDPFVLQDKSESAVDKGKVIRPGSVEERRKAMMDRIKAKSKGPTLGSAVGGDSLNRIRPNVSAVDQQEALKRRSTLSRLEGIAEGVWMMFSAPSVGPSSLPTPPRGRRKAIPMGEVAELIVKSSKTPISTAEAETSLRMLTELCPFFLTVKTVARKEWLEMPAAVAMAPPSPGTTLASSRLMSALSSSPGAGPITPGKMLIPGNEDDETPRRAVVPEEPGSPTPGSRKLPTLAPPVSPSKTLVSAARIAEGLQTPVSRVNGELAGPASPGRVKRVYGLREVRERIRRELGE